MPLTMGRVINKDRLLQYGTVAATLLKDIGNATNQPCLLGIASVSLLIMENVQRVQSNKDACMKMTERAYELVCAIINICHNTEAELAPAMVRSITQFSETLEKILTFVRNQITGSFWRRMFRSMEDAGLITDCNAGLKHALDVFGVQSGLIAVLTMNEMQKETKKRHQELLAMLNTKRSKKSSSTSGSDGSGSSRRKRSSKTDLARSISAVSMLPASPKIFYGRDEEIQHLTKLITLSKPARIAICGAEGLGKTAVALAASHSPEISQMFGVHRYFVECDGACDPKSLVAAIAMHLQLEGMGRKHVIRHLSAIATEETPALLILDALDRAWKPHENRSDVEDFLSLLADIQHLTLMVTVRGGERPRQVKWTRPFLPTLKPLPPAATRAIFLDISDVSPDEPDLEELLEITENNPGTITYMAHLASFEGCSSLVARWQQEGPALLLDRAERTPPPKPIFVDGGLCEEPEEMQMQARAPTVAAETDILSLLDPDVSAFTWAPMPTIDTLMKMKAPTSPIDGAGSGPGRGSLDSLMRLQSLDSVLVQSSLGSRRSSLERRQLSLGSSGSREGSLDGLLRSDSNVEVTTWPPPA